MYNIKNKRVHLAFFRESVDMLQFIVGRAGTGKTTRVWQAIREHAAAGRRSLLLVPEQFASTADLTGYLQLGDELHSFLKVCSFRSLTGMVEDRFGGGALQDISDAGRMVLMRRTLSQLGEQIVYFHRSRRSARFCANCTEVLQQLKYCGVAPELLETAAGGAGAGRARRLRELALIYRAYEEARDRTGLEPVDRISRAAGRVQPDFWAGTALFVDGFGEFTAPETALLRHAIAYAEQVTVTLTCPDDDFGAHRFTVFSPAAATGRYLRTMAAQAGVQESPAIVLRGNRRTLHPALAAAEEFLACGAVQQAAGAKTAGAETAGTQPAPADAGLTDGILCCAADGIYEEAMFAAARCAALGRAGVPYEQITVLCRDPAVYLPALQHAFALYEVPLFTGSTVSAEYAPMAVFLRAALGIAKNGLTGDGLLALLKTGLCSASEAALSALENYVYTWNPRAADWRMPFTQNPAGMDAGEPDEAALHLLELANSLRAHIVPAAESFRAECGKTGRSLSAALYHLLLRVGAQETVENWINDESAQGLGGFDSARMWQTVIGFLDEMAGLLGDEEITPAEYDDLLCTLLRSAEIGQAPQTQNQVQLAAADRVRLDNPDHILVLGLNEGIFPAPIGDSPLLTNDDRAQLSALGAPLSGDYENMVLREQMHLYRALTGARRSLMLSWLDKKNGVPQSVCAPVQQLCAALGLAVRNPTTEELALTPDAALELLCARWREDSPLTAALRRALEADPRTSPRLRTLTAAEQDTAFHVQDTGALRTLLGSSMTVSPSRMESYYECRFGYFLQYVLGVRPRPRAELGIPQSGTLVHWLMETLLTDFPALEGLSDEQLDAQVRCRIVAYAAEKLPGQSGRRFEYLLQRIGDNAVRLLLHIRDELAQGRFVPRAFEQPIGREEGIPPLEFTGSSGQKIRIIGTVDRVDTMEQNGRIWLRVVDYKTGSKSFSLDDVCFGINTQMLLYLFTLTKNGREKFGEATPAGVLYLLSDPAPASDEKKSVFSVDGIVLDDEAVLLGMDADGSGRWLPEGVKIVDDRPVGDKLVSLAMLGSIARRLEELIVQMADNLYSGDIAAQPLRHSKEHILRCGTCDYRTICRHRDGENETEVPRGIWKTILFGEDEKKEAKP